jgi:hypothetical protein
MLEAISYLKHMEKRSKRDWGAIYVYMALATCVSLGTPKAFFEFRFQKKKLSTIHGPCRMRSMHHGSMEHGIHTIEILSRTRTCILEGFLKI